MGNEPACRLGGISVKWDENFPFERMNLVTEDEFGLAQAQGIPHFTVVIEMWLDKSIINKN